MSASGELVESVAKAMALADGYTEQDWNTVPKRFWRSYLDMAQAASASIEGARRCAGP